MRHSRVGPDELSATDREQLVVVVADRNELSPNFGDGLKVQAAAWA